MDQFQVSEKENEMSAAGPKRKEETVGRTSPKIPFQTKALVNTLISRKSSQLCLLIYCFMIPYLYIPKTL